MLDHVSEQDLEDALTEFFLRDSVALFFLLYSFIYQFTNLINTV